MAPQKKKTASAKSSGKRKIRKVMHEYKEGTLKSGGSGKKVKSRKQAVAIALSEARSAGAKIPKKKKAVKKKAVKKKTVRKKAAAKKTATKKKSTKK